MAYTRRIPSPTLNDYIDDLYYLDGPAPYRRVKVLPMPSIHLMVNFGPGFHVYDPDHTGPIATCTESWSLGLWSRYHIVEWPLNTQLFGVHFKPGGAYPFLQVPLSELHNQVVSLDAIWGQYAAEMRERLSAAPTKAAGFDLFEQLLLARLREAPHGLAVVQYAIDELVRHDGAVSIRALSDHIGISQNHLGAQFKRMVGIPPKELARFYRFAHVLRAIDPTRPVDWTLIAHQAGFFDQSHFNKEFGAFTGHSPSDYLRRRRLQVEDAEHAQIATPRAGNGVDLDARAVYQCRQPRPAPDWLAGVPGSIGASALQQRGKHNGLTYRDNSSPGWRPRGRQPSSTCQETSP